MAEELANRNAPPTPWKIGTMMIHHAPGTPVIQVMDSMIEKNVNPAKPGLQIRTRPGPSPALPPGRHTHFSSDPGNLTLTSWLTSGPVRNCWPLALRAGRLAGAARPRRG